MVWSLRSDVVIQALFPFKMLTADCWLTLETSRGFELIWTTVTQPNELMDTFPTLWSLSCLIQEVIFWLQLHILNNFYFSPYSCFYLLTLLPDFSGGVDQSVTHLSNFCMFTTLNIDTNLSLTLVVKHLKVPKTRVSHIRPRDQNQPVKDSSVHFDSKFWFILITDFWLKCELVFVLI